MTYVYTVGPLGGVEQLLFNYFQISSKLLLDIYTKKKSLLSKKGI